jgi:vacuolar-type H+-ATPase catalytic subunit A/Vma1
MRKENFLQEVARLKGTKTNLNAQKIILSSVDVIREALDMQYLEDEVYDRIDEAQSKMIEARDIFRFEMAQHLGTAEDELNNLKSKLEELGVDVNNSDAVFDLQEEIYDREDVFDEIRRRFNDMGYDPIS